MKNINKVLLVLALLLANSFAGKAQVHVFNYTGSIQFWTVPTGIYNIRVDAQGASGGGPFGPGLIDRGGYGGCVVCTLAVVPGQVFQVVVGGSGSNGTVIAGGIGGYNGGANGGYESISASYSGGGGGGASDIRISPFSLSTRVVVAGGGGGAGGDYTFAPDSERGGDGGGTTGEDGVYAYTSPHPYGGGGGTPVTGGAGAVFAGWGSGVAGSPGAGGVGGTPSTGGGGGGGYFGGGGGSWGGGGGGSSYTDPAALSPVHTRGCNTSPDGIVTITEICITPSAGAIVGPTSLCQGDPATYTNPTGTPGGVWTSNTPGVATIDAVTGVLTTGAAGSTLIEYTLTMVCGTATTSMVVTVNAAPTPITSPGTLCTGNPVTLGSSPSGGTWVSTVPAVATIGSSTGVITGVGIGTSVVSYTLPGGCYQTTTVNVVGITGRQNVCIADTADLSASVPGGTWSTANPAIATVDTAGIVSGVSIGVVNITYTTTVGCFAIASMTVNPIAPIVGNDSVCVGSGTYLTKIVGGGVWTSSFPAIASISSDSGLVYGLSPGVTNITYTLPTGCVAYGNVTAIAMPSAITGVNQVCPGGITSLANATPGGVWRSNNPGVATVTPTTGVVTGVFADTTSIYYTILPNCTVSEIVTVNPTPQPIVARSPICPGIADTLFSASPGGMWSSNTPALATVIDSSGITYNQFGPGGTAIFKYTLPTGCTTTTAVTILPSPVPIVTYNWISKTMYTPDIWEAYQWYDSTEGLIPMANSPNCAALHTQWYFVEVTDVIGCKGRSAKFHFWIEQLGVTIPEGVKVHIYPNPATSTVNIESSVKVKAILSAMDGRKLTETEDAKQIDVSKLANGVYMITLYDESGQVVTVQKLVKE